MPRPVKCRKVCHFPNVLEFLPADNAEKKAPIVLTVDELSLIHISKHASSVSISEVIDTGVNSNLYATAISPTIPDEVSAP